MFLGLARGVDLDQDGLTPIRTGGQGAGQVQRVDRLDQRESARYLPDLVGLQVADQVPLCLRQLGQLRQRLLDAVLTQRVDPGRERRPALVQRSALGRGEDADDRQVSTRLLDPAPDFREPFGDQAVDSATMPAKREPSPSRRCEGRRSSSRVHAPCRNTFDSMTPASTSARWLAAARSSRNLPFALGRTTSSGKRSATSAPTS